MSSDKTPPKATVGTKSNRRSISRPSLVRAIKKELNEVGLADTASIKTFLDAVKDAYVEDNFNS